MGLGAWNDPKDLRDLLEAHGLDVVDVVQEPDFWKIAARLDGRDCSIMILHRRPILAVRAEVRSGEGRPTRVGVTARGELVAQASRLDGTLTLATAFPRNAETGPRAMTAFVELLTELAGGPDDWAFLSLDAPVIGRVPFGLWAGGAGITAASLAAFASLVFIPVLPDLILVHYASYFGAPTGIAMLAGATAKRRALLTAHERAAGALAKLKASAVFDEVASIGRVESGWPRVGIFKDREHDLGSLPVRIAALEAGSSRYGVRLCMRLHRVVKPHGLMDGFDLLPSSWAVLGLTGLDETLSAVPSLPGEERSPGSIRALLTEEDLARGALEDWLVRLEPALMATAAGPYR